MLQYACMWASGLNNLSTRRVLVCQMLHAPGDGTTPQGLSQSAGRGSVLRRGKVYCLAVTGPVDGAVRDANGSAATPGSRSSTMNLSVTRRLPPAVLPHATDKNYPPPNITDTSCLRSRPQIDGGSAEGFQVALPSGGHVGHPCLQVTIAENGWLCFQTSNINKFSFFLERANCKLAHSVLVLRWYN